MKKQRYIATSAVLILLLIGTLATTIPSTKAYDNGYGYASNLYTTNWIQYADHAQQVSTASSQITTLFQQHGSAYYWDDNYQTWFSYGPAFGEVNNWGHNVYDENVYDQITHDNSGHSTFSTILYIVHGGPEGFYVHSDDPDNEDQPPDPYVAFDQSFSPGLRNVSDLMTSQNSDAFQFVFMWVCMGGNSSPDGSPSAWNPLWWSYPPGHPSYTWIGFDNFSPWLYEGMGTYGQFGQENIYRYWLVFFYYYALQGNSIMTALNYASSATGFSNYGSSRLGAGYQSYWPYHQIIQGEHIYPGNYTGRMHVAGDPYGTYIPSEYYSE